MVKGLKVSAFLFIMATSLTSLAIAAALSGAANSGQPIAVFQIKSASHLDGVQRNSGQRVSFGLSPAKQQRLYELSKGRVDFRNIYNVKVLSKSHAHELVNLPGYQTVILPHVPPPVLTDEVQADPELVDQWWFKKLQIAQTWQIATGLGVTIADCDAGFHVEEPDLNQNLLVDFRYSFADPVNPLNITDGGFIWHGTAVAAIMAGVHDAHGTNGIAFNAKLVPLQNYSYSPRDKIDKEEATARCILGAIKVPHVKVLVLENQTPTGSSETYVGTREAVKLALAAGITIVSAGGNYHQELVAELKEDTGSIIVGALNPDSTVASFSNFGARITTAAFGSNLHTLYGPGGKFGEFGGTSGATPQVAATVALMLEANPRLLPEQVRKILQGTNIKSDGNASVAGQVNPLAAVRAAKQFEGSSQSYAARARLRRQIIEVLEAR